MANYQITDNDLVIGILNVGFGDNIVIRFPINNGVFPFGIVDCYKADKTMNYIKDIAGSRNFVVDYICATHPHSDHILGINKLLSTGPFIPTEFWDCGFRHNSSTYRSILSKIKNLPNTKMIRVSSGMERYFGTTSVTVLAPSINLRNRYATYGVDMNNASIVLRLENHKRNVLEILSEEYDGNESKEAIRRAGKSVVILSGDAEYDSWSHITQEFPILEKTSANNPLVKKMTNFLACHTIKVAHHGSMHSCPLDVYEKMEPNLAVISTKQEISTIAGRSRNLFPHDTTTLSLQECDADIITTDGCIDPQEGSVIIAIPPGGTPKWEKTDDSPKNNVQVPHFLTNP